MYLILPLILAGTVCAIPRPTIVQPQARAATGVPSPSSAESTLLSLQIAPLGPSDGYSRQKFPTWAIQSGNCNTRDVVLERDGSNVKTNNKCEAISGTWISPYDGKILTNETSMQIDHMVPLANAWRSGASEWTTDERKTFANDLVHPQLWAVSGTANNNKSDSSPDEWKPPLSSFWCTYASSWVAVKGNYNLTVTAAEKSALASMLESC